MGAAAPCAAPHLPMDPARSIHYGTDAYGLICGYAFTPGAAAESIDAEQAVARLQTCRDPAAPAAAGAGFLWLHFNLSHSAAERWLQRHAGLSQDFFETLREGTHSTRIERAEQSLIAVINDVQYDFSFEASDIATLCISVDRHLVVTARQSPLRSVDQLRTDVKAGAPIRSPTELLERLLRAQAEVLVGVVRGVTQRIDSIEDQLLAGRLDHKRVRLGVLRRLLVRLQRLLAPEPAALFRLLQRPVAWMDERDVEDLREATEEFSVALRDMTALQERCKLLQEEIAAAVQEQTGRSLFVLTVVTVLALPINILAGLFGMNVGGIPLAEDKHGFWILLATVATFTVIAAWVAFRRRG